MDLVAGIIGVSSKSSVFKFYQDLIKAEYLIKDGTNYLPTIKLQSIPYYESVQAGFPSPATDDLKQDMKVEDYLVPNPLSTIYVKVSGDSMVDAGIHAGDILVVDKGAKSDCGDIVVAVVDGDYTVKYLDRNQN